MIEFLDVNYNSLSKITDELFFLRKKTFKDRLDWMVDCKGDMEFDNYDNESATYILGVHEGEVFCGLRFIETSRPNMIIDTFQPYFNNIVLPQGPYVEASRLFIDKNRVHSHFLKKYPISQILFLSMLNYAEKFGSQGIYAIVSHPMLIIFQRSGWEVLVIQNGASEKKENIYLIYMPVDKHNQEILIKRINEKMEIAVDRLVAWPLSIRLRSDGPDQPQLYAKPYGMLGVSDA